MHIVRVIRNFARLQMTRFTIFELFSCFHINTRLYILLIVLSAVMASLSVLPALSVAVSVVSVVNVHGCKTESDCSLNGLCTAGACRCDQPWSGPACATLDFEPAPAGGMYGFGTPFHTSSWGGNAVEDGGLWHLFVTEIAGAGCGLHKWGQQSTVTHATSKVPEGPYEKQGLALPHQAHNPQAIKIGEWWHIFHIGGALNNTAISPCNETVPPVPLPPHQLPVSLGGGSGSAKGGGATLHRSRSPFGPWEPVVGCPALNNPSPFLHPNGSLFLVGSRPFEMRSSLSGSSTGPVATPPKTNSFLVHSRTLHQCPLGAVASYLLYADVRTFR